LDTLETINPFCLSHRGFDRTWIDIDAMHSRPGTDLSFVAPATLNGLCIEPAPVILKRDIMKG
jgi:hypothetical protein